MARAILITNPVAARTTARALGAALEVLTRAGWRLDVVPTEGPGHARRLAAAAVAEQVDIVVVQGGDGTTMQAAAALVGTEIPLGLIPSGTGNLLAGNLRIPRRPDLAARLLVHGARRRIDLGRMDRSHGAAYFGVGCGTGVDAVVMPATQTAHKRRWGFWAYVATTLRALPQITSLRHTITVDGERFETEAAMVLVVNCGEVIPPFVRLGRGIAPDDGVLDLITLRADGVGQSVRAVVELLRGLPPAGRQGSFIGYARGREVTVETQRPEPVEMDGEPDGVTPFTAVVVPGAISVITPKG